MECFCAFPRVFENPRLLRSQARFIINCLLQHVAFLKVRIVQIQPINQFVFLSLPNHYVYLSQLFQSLPMLLHQNGSEHVALLQFIVLHILPLPIPCNLNGNCVFEKMTGRELASNAILAASRCLSARMYSERADNDFSSLSATIRS